MAKLNTSQMRSQNTVANKRVVNREGGEGFIHKNIETEYMTQLLTSFFNEKKFYGDNSKDLQHNMQQIAETNPEFFIKSLAFARNEMNMRTTPIVGLATAARINETKPYVKNWAARIIRRADEPGEVIAAYRSMYGKRSVVPMCLRKGITNALNNNFDEYQLGKYKEKGGLKLVDVFNLVHPKPTPEKEELFKKVIEGNIPIPYTWETVTSERGSTKKVWEELIASNKMGYMALLRNLRNFMEKGVSNIGIALETLSDKERVRRSKQLPFRFISAHREIENTNGDHFIKNEILQALNTALSHSVDNLNLPGRTAVLFDNSGSMGCTISNKSSLKYYDIANVLAALIMLQGGLGVAFGTEAKMVPLDYVNKSNLLAVGAHLHNTMDVGHATNVHRAIDILTDSNTKVDRIILLSDMQCWNTMWGVPETFRSVFQRYRKILNNKCWLHSIDLAGYGTAVVPDNDSNINLLAGWSDKVLEYIPMVEAGQGGLIEAIQNYK